MTFRAWLDLAVPVWFKVPAEHSLFSSAKKTIAAGVDPILLTRGPDRLYAAGMPAGLFSKRVQDAVGLSQADREALRSLRVMERALDHREPLWREGEAATQTAVVHSGFLASYKMSADREQILAFHVPGDFPDLQALYVPVFDHSIISIGPSVVGLIPHADLKDLLLRSHSLAGVFWRETILETIILREWICNIAARDALSSFAHLICEIASRLEAVGLVTGDCFSLPLTQQDIADALGLSVVHVNRTLQQLRKRRLISWAQRTITLLDLKELKRVAQFEPDYLRREPA